MHQTLLYIPTHIAGVPVFGAGLLLALWGLFSLGLLVWLVRQHGFKGETWSYLPVIVLVGAVIRWLLPALAKPQGVPIQGYGVMLLLAVAGGTGLAAWRAKRRGLDVDMVYALALWLFVPGIIGARLFYVIEYWRSFQHDTVAQTILAMANVAEGGLVVYGSFIGGALGLLVFVRKYRLPLLPLGDLIAPSVMLGLALGRVGCLLNGCCFGGTCDLPWAVTFPWGSPPHVYEFRHGQIFAHGLKLAGQANDPPVIKAVEPGSAAEHAGLRPGQRIVEIGGQPVATVDEAQQWLIFHNQPGTPLAIRVDGAPTAMRWMIEHVGRSLPVHPTQVYSTINALLLCLLLLAFEPFRRRDGEVFALVLTLYPIGRFLLESIRTDEAAIFGTGMSISQNVSVAVLLAAVALWGYVLRQPRRMPSPKAH